MNRIQVFVINRFDEKIKIDILIAFRTLVTLMNIIFSFGSSDANLNIEETELANIYGEIRRRSEEV